MYAGALLKPSSKDTEAFVNPLHAMAGDAATSSVVSPQNVAFGAKLVTLCVILGVSLLGVGTGFFLNAYVYASRCAQLAHLARLPDC